MPNKVTKEQIQKIMDNSKYEVFHRVFDKQCLVVAKLPNGFTVVGESACVDPSIYDEEIGVKLAKQRIEERLWELEGYALQKELHGEKGENNLQNVIINIETKKVGEVVVEKVTKEFKNITANNII